MLTMNLLLQTHISEKTTFIIAADSTPCVPGSISVWRHRTEPYLAVGIWKYVSRPVSLAFLLGTACGGSYTLRLVFAFYKTSF